MPRGFRHGSALRALNLKKSLSELSATWGLLVSKQKKQAQRTKKQKALTSAHLKPKMLLKKL
jgi:hypothetical protein